MSNLAVNTRATAPTYLAKLFEYIEAFHGQYDGPDMVSHVEAKARLIMLGSEVAALGLGNHGDGASLRRAARPDAFDPAT